MEDDWLSIQKTVPDLRLGEIVKVYINNNVDTMLLAIVVDLNPLTVACNHKLGMEYGPLNGLCFYGLDIPIIGKRSYCWSQWQPSASEIRQGSFSGRSQFVTTKEEALTHYQPYIREVLAPRLE